MKNQKIVFILFILIMGYNMTMAQKYKGEGFVTFFSEAPLENIDAKNVKGSSVFDKVTNNIVFSFPIKSFEFEKSLMQEHFNENYMESDKYPKALFTGKVVGFGESEEVTAEGDLTIHGVTKKVTVKGKMKEAGDEIKVEASFIVRLEDYEVEIPKMLFQNIAEEVKVDLNFEYSPI